MNEAEIQKMSISERILTMEALWDSLLADESNIESPEWHGDVLRERQKKIENGEMEFISLEEFKKRHCK